MALKFDVIVPAPFTVAKVEFDEAESKTMLPVVVQDANLQPALAAADTGKSPTLTQTPAAIDGLTVPPSIGSTAK